MSSPRNRSAICLKSQSLVHLRSPQTPRYRMKPTLLAILLPVLAQASPPNFLILLADDCTYNDLPLYGGPNAKTPHLDQLATQGLTFDRAYVSSAMCQPCRAELYTGQFPFRNGCAWNHSACRPGTRSLPHHLAPLGYRTGIAGKIHVKPDEAFPFEDVPGFDPNAVRNPTQPHDLAGLNAFLTRDAAQPFCLVIGLTEPHVPWVMGDASAYPPAKLTLPPNLADTPKTRQDFAAYLAEITFMDGQVGAILAALQDSGQAENTLVLFSSEQGSQFPGNKWTCWDTGLHTALVARWPGQIAEGTRTNALVQYADVVPTLLDLAGGSPAPQDFDGTSFAAVLRGQTDIHRAFAYAAHHNVPEGPPYPIRSVTDGTWRYIRNLAPGELFIEKHLMGLLGGSAVHNAYWSSWMATAGENPRTYALVKRYLTRPAEELYHTAADPHEQTNLIADPAHASILTKLRTALEAWRIAQHDPGPSLDSPEFHQAAQRGEHFPFSQP